MIGSITDQGRASATKSKLSALKSALLTYNSDVGRFPFMGLPANVNSAGAYVESDLLLLGDSMETNILVNEEIGNEDAVVTDFGIRNYNRRWKGPYMDSDPSDFMLDAWGTKVSYYTKEGINNIYLWAAGPDMGNAGSIEDATNVELTESGEVDDIAISIARVRRSFGP